MSKEIRVTVDIEGNTIKTFNTLRIQQAFNAHHNFELLVDHDTLEATGAHTLQSSQDYIGKFITICFGEDLGHNSFKGLITEVGLAQDQGLWGNLVLKGYSPTYLMEGGKHNTSFYERNLKDMFAEATKGVASNDMEIVNSPKYRKPIAYMCQYTESNFAFVNRLAAEYGEFFYYDGRHLFFGKPSNADHLDMVYGEQIEQMNFAMRMAAANIQHYSYNSKEHQVIQAKLPSTVLGADNYTEKAVQTSGKLYSQTVSQPVPVRSADKEELDQYAANHMGRLAASMVCLSAKGDEPKLKLGTIIKLKVSQKGLGIGHNTHGEYLVTSLTHTITGTGTYSNSFEAIPSGSMQIPFEAPKPVAETQVATVTDNADPEGMGRVRVQMLWQKAKGQQTDWIRVMSSDAGGSGQVSKNRGHVFIPEVGDEVLVGFRYNDPNRPFVMGSMFHGQVAAGGGVDNTVKSIKTRSGHTLEFNDSQGRESITITDKSGNTILLDTSGKNITITAPETISINAKNIIMNAAENISTSAGANITESAGVNKATSVGMMMNTFVGGNNVLNVAGNFIEHITGNLESHTEKDRVINSQKGITTTSEGEIAKHSQKEMKLNSAEKSKLF